MTDTFADEPDEDVQVLGHDLWARNVKELLGLFDTPAYLRRARRMQDAVRGLLLRCESEREDYAKGVRIHLRAWNVLVTRKPDVLDTQPAEVLEAIRQLEETIGVGKPLPNARPGRPARILRDLAGSVDRFNSRWSRFLKQLDFDSINRLIDGYNRNYLVEKECAFRSAKLAARGFEPMEPISPGLLFEKFPTIPPFPTGRKSGEGHLSATTRIVIRYS